jgi:hypothetical protein
MAATSAATTSQYRGGRSARTPIDREQRQQPGERHRSRDPQRCRGRRGQDAGVDLHVDQPEHAADERAEPLPGLGARTGLCHHILHVVECTIFDRVH